MINILLVEDDLDLAATVVQYLELEEINCDHASNGLAGLQLIREQHYDGLLLDINLPRMDGLSLCQKLRNEGRDTPVLMLTARDQLQDKIEGFNAGTDDYLVKPFALEELVVRLRALVRRRSGQIRRLSCADLMMDFDQKRSFRGERELKLSPLNWRLLETLLRASPRVVSRAQLEQALWGDTLPYSDTLKVHWFKLRKIVDTEGEEQLLHTVPGQGFSLQAGRSDS